MNHSTEPRPSSHLWHWINRHCDFYGLWLLRILNVGIFLAIVFYVGSHVTGYNLVQMIYFLSIIWGIIRGFDVDFIVMVGRKMISFQWGISLFVFIVFVLFLFHFRWSYVKELSSRLCPKPQ